MYFARLLPASTGVIIVMVAFILRFASLVLIMACLGYGVGFTHVFDPLSRSKTFSVLIRMTLLAHEEGALPMIRAYPFC